MFSAAECCVFLSQQTNEMLPGEIKREMKIRLGKTVDMYQTVIEKIEHFRTCVYDAHGRSK